MTTTTPIRAWHGNGDLKTAVVARMRAHCAADEIIHGVYQELDPDTASGYRGCLIGCTLPAQPDGEPAEGWHSQVAAEYGIPTDLAHLLDKIFEHLPHGDHARFAVDSIDAVGVGVDLSQVTSRMMLDFLTDPDHGVCRRTEAGSAQHTQVQAVAGLYRRRLAGDEPTHQEWANAEASAGATDGAGANAARAAAQAATAAASAQADWLTAETAWAAVAETAWAAVAWAAGWQWAAQRLLHHLTAAETLTEPTDFEQRKTGDRD